MPPTPRISNSELSIQLQAERNAYFPGDTIIGSVGRMMPLVSPRARVKITLHGRTKSKLVRSNGQSSTTYRGRFNVINSSRHAQLLFDGPVHVEGHSGGQTWPFVVTIPTYVESNGDRSEQETFIPSDVASMSTHPLPPSFKGCKHSTEGFVEYWLQAELTTHGNRDSITRESTLPLFLKERNMAPPIAPQLVRGRFPLGVVSQRLIPGMEEGELSTGQKMKKFFRSESVPRFNFHLEVDFPTTLQLGHPEPLQWKVRAVPDWGKSSPELDKVPQRVRIVGGSMHIRQITEVKCAGHWSTKNEDFDEKADLRLDTPFGRAALANHFIEAPCTDEWPPIDIGELFNMRLGYNGFPWQTALGFYYGQLTPTFSTYNVRVRHQMSWSLRLLIAKEELRVKSRGEFPIHLLGSPADSGPGYEFIAPALEVRQTDSWIQPPAEEEPPPSFAEVQMQDKKESSKNKEAVEKGESAPASASASASASKTV